MGNVVIYTVRQYIFVNHQRLYRSYHVAIPLISLDVLVRRTALIAELDFYMIYA